MPWTCTRCNDVFERKQNYERHLKSARHIKRTQSEQELFTCDICTKHFSYKRSLINHQKLRKCKYLHKKETEIEIMRDKIHTFEKERDEMKAQISLLLAKSTGNTTNRNSNNNTHIENQHVNIVVNSFGNENIEHLTDKLVCKLIQAGPFTCLPKIIERIHFDPEHPENHNIKVTNLKNRYAKIVKDNKWITTNKKQVIDTMIQNGYGLLEEKYQDNKESISEFKQERFEDFQEKYCDQDKDLIKTIKENVDIAIINGSNQLHK